MNPKVTIVTVVLNGAKTIEQTILSVKNQDYNNKEYIIIDGGSTDGTLDIIKRYGDTIDYWQSAQDKGLYDAMNKGIALAKGELIGIINSDDWYEPNTISSVVGYYRQNPTKKIFHGDIYEILENGHKRIRRFNSSPFKFLYYGMTYNHPAMFIHSDLYMSSQYDSIYRGHADYKFVLEAYLKDKTQFKYIPEAYSNFRLGGVSANISVIESTKAVFKIRRDAGLSLFSACFAFLLMRLVKAVFFIKKFAVHNKKNET